MEITIKISLSPGEEKGAASVATLGGPVPSLVPGLVIECSRPAEIASIQEDIPIPESFDVEPSITPDALMYSMIAGESPPVPMAASQAGKESPAPDFIPGIPSGKEPKE